MNNLDSVYKEIEKKFGKGIIVNTTDDIPKVDVISTGSIELDGALGIGGIPKGRIIEIFGQPSGGKSTLAISITKNTQILKQKAVYIDMEHSFNYEFAEKMGIDIKNLIIVQPDNGEMALEIVNMYAESGEIAIIIVDSVASLVPQAELEGEMIDNTIGLQARLISKALRKLNGVISKTNTALVFINQVRENINTMGYGEKTTTPGGRALKFYASIRIDVRYAGTIKKGEEAIGIEVKAKISKNKLASPFKTACFRIYFDTGLSEAGDILFNAIKKEIIKKSGAWYAYKDHKWQGEEQIREELNKNNKLVDELKKEVLNGNL